MAIAFYLSYNFWCLFVCSMHSFISFQDPTEVLVVVDTRTTLPVQLGTPFSSDIQAFIHMLVYGHSFYSSVLDI